MLSFCEASSLVLPTLEQQPTTQGGQTHLGSAVEGFPSSHRLTFSEFSAHRNNGNRGTEQPALFKAVHVNHTSKGQKDSVSPSLLSSQPCLFGLLDDEYGEGCCFLSKMEETTAWVNSELPTGSGNYVFWQFTYTCVYII